MSVPMAMPEDFTLMGDFSTPSYFIYRDCLPGEPFDPTAPLKFFPAKDSDELFDALRAKYPHVPTHAERMRDATIEFLIEERNAEALQASPAFTMDSTPTLWPSGSTDSTASFNSSPELYNFATPNSFEHSPASSQAAVCAAAPASNASTSGQSPPSLDQMTGVFSIATSAQPKPRVRRKMTAAERVEYRNRRIVKACDKCAKRKRKCIHDQPATQASTPSVAATKMAKSSSSSSTSSSRAAKPVAYLQPPRPSLVTETSMMTDISQDDMSTMLDSGSFADTTMGFDDVMDDFDFNGYYDVEFKSDNRLHQWSRESGSGFSNEHFSPTQALPDFQLFDNSPAPSAYNDSSDSSRSALQSFPSLVSLDQRQGSTNEPNYRSGIEGSGPSQQATSTDSETIHTTNKRQSKNTRSSTTVAAGHQNRLRSSEQQSAAQALGLSRWDARGHSSPSDDIPSLGNQRLDGSTQSSTTTTSRSHSRDQVAHATTQNIPAARITSGAETNDNAMNSANIETRSDKSQHQPSANTNVRTGRSAAALEMYSLRRRMTTGPQLAANNDRASLSIAGMPGSIGLIGLDNFGHIPSTNAPVLQTNSGIRAIANTDRNASSNFSGNFSCDVPGDAAQATSQNRHAQQSSGGIAVARSLSSTAPSPMRSRISLQGPALSVHDQNAGISVSMAVSPTVPVIPRLRDTATKRGEPTHNLHTHGQAKAELARSPEASPSLQLQAPVNTASKLRLGASAPRRIHTDKMSLPQSRSLQNPSPSAAAIAPTVHLQGLVAATTPYTPERQLSTSVLGSAIPSLLVLAACVSLPVLQAAAATSYDVVLPSATALAFVAVLAAVLGLSASAHEEASMAQSKNMAWSQVSRAVNGARKTATALVNKHDSWTWALRNLTAVMV